MQDRFKFRVWSKANNKYCHHITTDLSADGLLRVLRPLEKSEYIDDWEHQYDIQQCTGLKDKNGKLIYEGDIITFEKSQKTEELRKGVVKYYKQYCWFFVEVSENKWARPFNTIPDRQYLEVIGNIYENAELLEE